VEAHASTGVELINDGKGDAGTNKNNKVRRGETGGATTVTVNMHVKRWWGWIDEAERA